jgi:hypothetical protein
MGICFSDSIQAKNKCKFSGTINQVHPTPSTNITSLSQEEKHRRFEMLEQDLHNSGLLLFVSQY